VTKPQFVYVIYIKATPEAIWGGLLDPAMTRKYWMHDNISDRKAGSPWTHARNDAAGTVDIVGTVIESTPPKRLTVSHTDLEPDSTMLHSVSFDWPALMSGLKTLLERASAT